MTTMAGIHAVQTKPVEVQAAVWDPNDTFQRGLVLGWLSTLGGIEYEIGSEVGGLHLYFDRAHLYVAPGQAIVLDPVSGFISAYDKAVVAETFDYIAPIVDPNQPALFDYVVSIDPAGCEACTPVVVFSVPRT